MDLIEIFWMLEANNTVIPKDWMWMATTMYYIYFILKYSSCFSNFSVDQWKESLQHSSGYLYVHLSASHSLSNSFWMCWSFLIKFDRGIETSKAIMFLWASWKPAHVAFSSTWFWSKHHDSLENGRFLFCPMRVIAV